MVRDELFVLVAEDEHVIFQGDEVQVLIKNLQNKHYSYQSTENIGKHVTWLNSHIICNL